MTIEQIIVLAIVQGVTEFLPISSSGHLIIVPQVMHWQDQGLVVDVMTHVGTLFAITACGYGAMTVRMIEPHEFTAGDKFFDQYGLWLMVGELGVLTVLTFLAIGTDDYWVKRAEAKAQSTAEHKS